VLSALTGDVAITIAIVQKNNEARILPPSTHSLITKACQHGVASVKPTVPKQLWNAAVRVPQRHLH